MAFVVKKLEAVNFGDFEVAPKMTADASLRLSQFKWETSEQLTQNKQFIAELFGDKQIAVAEVLDLLPYAELMRLWAYLVNGDKAVEAYEKVMDNLAEQTEAKVKETNNG